MSPRSLHVIFITVLLGFPHFGFSQVSPPPRYSPGDGKKPPVNTSAAEAQGRADGRQAGLRDGAQEGRRRGQSEGEQQGHRRGFEQCEAEARRDAHDRGYQQAYQQGERRGLRDGDLKGRNDGQDRGRSEGASDGLRRADADAKASSYHSGRERGLAEADRSDAHARGQTDGLQQGDQQALADATRVDYQRGRTEKREQTWAEAILSDDQFAQKSPRLANFSGGSVDPVTVPRDYQGTAQIQQLTQTVKTASFNTPEERQAYERAYRESYESAKREADRANYDRAYHEASRLAHERGCREAMRRDYSADYRRGESDGDREGYRKGYDYAYQISYRQHYDSEFRNSSDRAYHQNYDRLYNLHFEAARSEAYQARYGEIYNAAYRAAFDQKYNQAYPLYAQQKYQEGQRDEAQDFVQRPLRLTEVLATETLPNGLMEPGEELRVQFKVRNFSRQILAGSRVRIELSAQDQRGSVIGEPRSSLVKGLKASSLTTVGQALAFTMTEAMVDRVAQFTFRVFVDGRESDTAQFKVSTKFIANLTVQKWPDLKEGLPSKMVVAVRNQSMTSTLNSLSLELSSHSEAIEVVDGTQVLGPLNSGETHHIEFTVISRSHDSTQRLPLSVELREPSGRRIGLHSSEQDIGLSNDYRISVLTGLDKLRQSGVVRLEYEISNRLADTLMKGLQLYARVTGPGAQEIVVLGPNPQYLSPLIRGQSTRFVVPVLVKTPQQSGTIELEVHEEGRPVVIHRNSF